MVKVYGLALRAGRWAKPQAVTVTVDYRIGRTNDPGLHVQDFLKQDPPVNSMVGAVQGVSVIPQRDSLGMTDSASLCWGTLTPVGGDGPRRRLLV